MSSHSLPNSPIGVGGRRRSSTPLRSQHAREWLTMVAREENSNAARIQSLKSRLYDAYTDYLTRVGTFVSPRINWSALDENFSDTNVRTFHDSHRAWPVLKADPADRVSVGIAGKRDGNLSLVVGLAKNNADAFQYFSKILSNDVDIVVKSQAYEFMKPSHPSNKSDVRTILADRFRPLQLGTSVGVAGGGAGSIGPFVVGREGTQSPVQLGFVGDISVLAPGESKRPGAIAHQPSPSDSRSAPSVNGRVGEVFDFVELTRSTSNEAPCAIVNLDPEIEVEGNFVPKFVKSDIAGLEIRKTVRNPIAVLGETVGKVGRTTGYTRGIVSVVEILGLVVRIGRRNYVFDDVIEVHSEDDTTPFSSPGDSGSLVFVENTGEALGIVFSQIGNITYVIKAESFLNVFNVDLFVT